ncbi:iron-sulfur cluster biosynthesis family protein [Oceanobacillus rekensis]|uniref:iron-sulfur cluster biosynthesis family protein n=1 Tax=Oceanobacillus rekensis TaxID=937927 RepID=UPI000B4504E8|nr:iron-sulfur cluster biosynthesis family protein [Oceanobacillus rekensis]
MKLMITPEAKQQLKQLNKDKDSQLLLWYDVEDCGCGVNGLPTIRFIKEKKSYYAPIDNDSVTTYIDADQAVFFAEEMKLDIHKGTFRLSSKEGILNPFIPTQNLLQNDEV